MSLAVPATFSEYIFDSGTRQSVPAMICNGGIMPLRNGGAGSVDYVNALRGEDVFFLMEAVYARHAFTDYSQSPNYAGIDCEIKKARLEATRDKIVTIKNAWQATAPTVYAHDFGTVQPSRADVTAWLITQISGIGVPAVQGMAFDALCRSQIMAFFGDVKKLNFSVDCAQRNVITCDTSHSVWGQSQVGTATPDDYYYASNFFSFSDFEAYRTGTSAISYTTTKWTRETSLNNSLKAQFSVPAADDFAAVVDVRPLILVRVFNSWFWENSDHGTHDNGDVTHWVIVPADSGFFDITAGGVFLNAADPSGLIATAFGTAGLQRYAENIPFGSTPDSSGNWSIRQQSEAEVAGVFALIHFKYCNLENVNV